nr:HupE/UreJ family protein [Luteibacter sp. SG786]
MAAGWVETAMAHAGTGLAGGFAAGFSHPFGGMDHLLAMVSVGLWGAFLGQPLIYRLPVVFPGLMVVGAIFGMAGVALPPVEWGTAFSVLVLGICIAAAWRPPAWFALAVVAVFGLFHGYAHGKELPSAADPVGYAAGFVLVTGSLHVLGIGLGEVKRRRAGMRLLRCAGAIVAAAGVAFVAEAARSVRVGHTLLPWIVLAVVVGIVAMSCAAMARHATAGRATPAVAWRVLLSWLLAVALLTATLACLPVTPGYAPDHLE